MFTSQFSTFNINQIYTCIDMAHAVKAHAAEGTEDSVRKLLNRNIDYRANEAENEN